MKDLALNSVNFEHGMLLTPEHFLRQEQYVDSALLWILRFAAPAAGLIGAGPRSEESEWGAIRYDPAIHIAVDETAVSISVTRARGITPSGFIVDVDALNPVSRRFAKTELEGVPECVIYLQAGLQKEISDGPVDEFNPQMKTERRPEYRLVLQPSANIVADSLAVGVIRRSRHGQGFERDSTYIPPSMNMAAHSELASAWRRLTELAGALESALIGLYRGMQEFLMFFKERGIETAVDVEAQTLVARLLTNLQLCLHEIADPIQPPRRFFGELHRFFRTSAIQFDLSPQVRGYFETLRECGETAFAPALEAQRRTASLRVAGELANDLSIEARGALEGFADLQRLIQALEGKYIDFRVNRSIEAMNFVFDRGGEALFRLAARPSRVQGSDQDLILTFTQLRLEGRDRYRLVIAGEQGRTLGPGSKIGVEIRINEPSGFRREPILLSAEIRVTGQCNVEYDFDAPDVPIITDLRVTVPAHYPIRTGMLFVRQRFYAGASSQSEAARRPREPLRDERLHKIPAVEAEPPAAAPEPAARREPVFPPAKRRRLE